MHRKSDKNRTEPNELDELKYSKSLTQMTNYAHRYVLVTVAKIKTEQMLLLLINPI